MGKFKVGDRVKAIESSGGRSFIEGNFYIVIGYDGDCIRAVNEKGERDNWCAKFFEHAPLFAVGDKVHCVADEGCMGEGLSGTVIEVGEAPAYVTVDFGGDFYGHGKSGHCWNFFRAETQLVAVAASNDNAAKPKFKVGDRVRLVKEGRSTTGAVGKLATVIAWSSGKVTDLGEYLLDIDPPVDYRTLAVTKNYTRAAPDCFELATTSCAAAQVDNLRDEYGPVVKPKFKVGDRVTVARKTGRNMPDVGTKGEITDTDVGYTVETDSGAYGYDEEDLELTPSTPAIVALIENGQPLPSHRPHVHATTEAATTEAERLANANKGKEFGVYQLVTTAKVLKTHDHEWQRLAATGGKKIEAIKELRRITGLISLRSAKAAVEDFLEQEVA